MFPCLLTSVYIFTTGWYLDRRRSSSEYQFACIEDCLRSPDTKRPCNAIMKCHRMARVFCEARFGPATLRLAMSVDSDADNAEDISIPTLSSDLLLNLKVKTFEADHDI